MPNMEKIIKDLDELYRLIYQSNVDGEILGSLHDAIALLKEQPEIVRCKDCRQYDELISLCDNCGLPREQTFFCADGKRKGLKNNK